MKKAAALHGLERSVGGLARLVQFRRYNTGMSGGDFISFPLRDTNRHHLKRRKCHAVYYAFDPLWLDGKDMRELPLVERKKILRSILPRNLPLFRLCEFHRTHPRAEAFRTGEGEGS
jgi:ATP dependent DNA ligase domain